MVFKNDSIRKVKELLQEVANITDVEISELALNHIKRNKIELIRINLPVQVKGKDAFFMAGSPGAGKTEFFRISFEEKINKIEADSIRKNHPVLQGRQQSSFPTGKL